MGTSCATRQASLCVQGWRARSAALSFPHKLILAFGLAIGIPLLGYALAVHALNETRMNEVDKAALDKRIRILEQHLESTGLTALYHATTAAAEFSRLEQDGHWGDHLRELGTRHALSGACIVYPDDSRPPTVLGHDLMLDAAVGASPFLEAALEEPTWGIMGMDGALAVVAAAPVGDSEAGAACPVLVLASRVDTDTLRTILGVDACTARVDTPDRDQGAALRSRMAARETTRPSGFAREVIHTRRASQGLETTVALVSAVQRVEPLLLTVGMHRAALPGRGPQFMTVALCALGCALLLAALLTSMVTTWVSRPLDDLRTRVEAVTEGRSNPPPMDVAADDALGRVARAFNDMVRNLDEIQRQAVRNERLIVAGKMAAAVAHEVRNVLAPIQLRAELLLQGVRDPVARENLNGMRDEVNRGAALLRSLLEFARCGPAEMRPLRVGDVVERAARLAAPQFREARVDLCVQDAAGDTSIIGDSAQMLQMLVNLLNNALDAEARSVTLSVETVNGDARIVVKDDGTGMDRATRERALEPFFTTKPAGRGTGLGLSICHGIARDHGGNLEIDSTRHVGTRVTVHLPITGARACPSESS